jgi:Domain of unknown function (DUF4112)
MRAATAQSIRISDKETLEWPTSEPGASPTSTQDLERLAHWLDTVFEIPGIRLRFGIDAILGLLPGLGDTASALASIYILQSASRYGVPRVTLARMTLNIGIDLLFGAIPIVGDLFDVYWKANRKNVELLRRHFKATPLTERHEKRSDSLFVAGMIALIAFILIASVTGAYYLLSWALASLSQLTH